MTQGASATARNMFIELTGALTAARVLNVPNNKKLYFIYNNTSGGFAVTVKVTGQTGVSVSNGTKTILVCNGTDIVLATTTVAPAAPGVTSVGATVPTFLTVAGSPVTSTGTLAISLSGSALPIANGGTGQTSLAALGNLFYPVGSIYSNTSNGTNPGTLLGFGTWASVGMGRVLLGAGTNGPNTFTAGQTGGVFDSTLPSHSHTATSTVSDPGHFHASSGGLNVGSGANAFVTANDRNPDNTSTASTGISVATSISTEGVTPTDANLPPYIVVYMWERTA